MVLNTLLAAILAFCTVSVQAQEGALDVRPGSSGHNSPDMGYVNSMEVGNFPMSLPGPNTGANIQNIRSRQFGEGAFFASEISGLNVSNRVLRFLSDGLAGSTSATSVCVNTLVFPIVGVALWT